jgi:hypothetical protein
MISTVQLLDRMVKHPIKDRQAIANPARGARQIDYQRLTRHPGQPSG